MPFRRTKLYDFFSILFFGSKIKIHKIMKASKKFNAKNELKVRTVDLVLYLCSGM